MELNNIQMTVAVTNDQQYILCYKHAYKMVSSFADRGCSCLSRWPHFMGHRWAFMCALFNAYLSAHINWVFLRSSDWCDVMSSSRVFLRSIKVMAECISLSNVTRCSAYINCHSHHSAVWCLDDMLYRGFVLYSHVSTRFELKPPG